MSELLIEPYKCRRASYQFRDEFPRTRDGGSLEDAIQGLREVAAVMGGGEKDDGGDGVDYVLEHGVILALEICLARSWSVSSWKFTGGIDGSLPLLQ